MAKTNLTSFNKQMSAVKKVADDLPAQAYDQFVKETPKRSGNARNKTRLEQNKIIADYPYSQRLDEGYSKKAPKGMVEPTEQWIQQEVDRRLRRI